MPQHDVVDPAGTPRAQHLYAVFDSPEEAQQAARALAQQGKDLRVLGEADDAAALASHDESSGIGGKLERLLKTIGGEKHEAERYAQHIQDGRTVAALAVPTRDEAWSVTHTLVELGAYDITYFSGWTIEHLSPQENIDRGLPTHTTSNVDE